MNTVNLKFVNGRLRPDLKDPTNAQETRDYGVAQKKAERAQKFLTRAQDMAQETMGNDQKDMVDFHSDRGKVATHSTESNEEDSRFLAYDPDNKSIETFESEVTGKFRTQSFARTVNFSNSGSLKLTWNESGSSGGSNEWSKSLSLIENDNGVLTLTET